MKKLIDLFGWVPFVGNALKIAYFSKKAHEVASGLKLPEEKVNANAEDLKALIEEKSEEAFDEHLQPEINRLNLPDLVNEKIKEKAIEIISEVLTKKYIKRVS